MAAYFKALEAIGDKMLPVLAVALDMPAGDFAPYFAEPGAPEPAVPALSAAADDDDEHFGPAPHTDNQAS